MPITSSPKVTFHFETAVPLPGRTKLKQFIQSIFENEGRILELLDIIFCSDEYLLRINREYLRHDDLTDIITFDLSDDMRSAAELYISVERVRENAALYQVTVMQELLRVIFHGVLHLCGYKDKSAKDVIVMRQKEAYYLLLYSTAS